MTGIAVPARIGNVDVLVETVRAAGTEQTSRLSDAAEGITDTFAKVRQTIVEMATTTAATIEEAAERGARPSTFAVEFGLKVAAQGQVLIAGVSGEATLRVTLTYSADAE